MDRPLHCVRRIMQRAAMRRVDANRVFRASLQANESGGFGPVSMEDVRLQLPGQAHEAQPGQNVPGRWSPADGEAVDAKLDTRRDFLETRLGPFPTGQPCCDEPHSV